MRAVDWLRSWDSNGDVRRQPTPGCGAARRRGGGGLGIPIAPMRSTLRVCSLAPHARCPCGVRCGLWLGLLSVVVVCGRACG
eukprot:990129-Prymnesium_polylepis.1